MQKDRRQLELEAEEVEQDLLPGNQQKYVLRLLTGTRLESSEEVSVNSAKATINNNNHSNSSRMDRSQSYVRHHGPGKYPGGGQQKQTTLPTSCLHQTPSKKRINWPN